MPVWEKWSPTLLCRMCRFEDSDEIVGAFVIVQDVMEEWVQHLAEGSEIVVSGLTGDQWE